MAIFLIVYAENSKILTSHVDFFRFSHLWIVYPLAKDGLMSDPVHPNFVPSSHTQCKQTNTRKAKSSQKPRPVTGPKTNTFFSPVKRLYLSIAPALARKPGTTGPSPTGSFF
jgi:hypothetical protein